MTGLFRHSLHLGLGLLRLSNLATLMFLFGALAAHRGHPLDLGPWLAWCLSAAVAATIAGGLGAELRQFSGQRLVLLLPNGHRRLLSSAALLLGLGLLPVGLFALGQDPIALELLGLAVLLSLCVLLAGLWLGLNGPVWLALLLMFTSMGVDEWLPTQISAAGLISFQLVAIGLLIWSLRRLFARPARTRPDGAWRVWLQAQPEQAISWRRVLPHASMGLLFLSMTYLPYLHGSVRYPIDPPGMLVLLFAIGFAGSVMISSAAVNESLQFRQRARRLLMLPCFDRASLFRQVEIGLFRLWLALAVLPTGAWMTWALVSGQLDAQLAIHAVLVLGMLMLWAWAGAWLANCRHGSEVFAGICGLALGLLPVLHGLFASLESEHWLAWSLAWLSLILIAAAWIRRRVRRAWQEQSLESIAHWLLLRLARPSSVS